MPQLTIPVKVGSPSHHRIIEAVERFGNNYRHRWKGEFYKIVGYKPKDNNGEFHLVLEGVL